MPAGLLLTDLSFIADRGILVPLLELSSHSLSLVYFPQLVFPKTKNFRILIYENTINFFTRFIYKKD